VGISLCQTAGCDTRRTVHFSIHIPIVYIDPWRKPSCRRRHRNGIQGYQLCQTVQAIITSNTFSQIHTNYLVSQVEHDPTCLSGTRVSTENVSHNLISIGLREQCWRIPALLVTSEHLALRHNQWCSVLQHLWRH
jgi:hypothetical protein